MVFLKIPSGISVTTQKSLKKIPYGISVPTQETCYSSIESRKNTTQIFQMVFFPDSSVLSQIFQMAFFPDSSKSNLLCCCNRFHVLSDIPDGIFSRLN
jgi:hypothetical protein